MKTITIRYGVDRLEKEFEDGATVSQILGAPGVKAGLGFSDNVRALVNGVELDMALSLEDGEELVIETRCNTKAQDNKTVVLRYGVDRMEKVVPYATTIGQLRLDPKIRASLGFGDNVRMLLNGVALSDDTVVPNAAEIVVETRCNEKAS